MENPSQLQPLPTDNSHNEVIDESNIRNVERNDGFSFAGWLLFLASPAFQTCDNPLAHESAME